MGIEIRVFDDDIEDTRKPKSNSSPAQVASLVRQTRQLAPPDLRDFFESLFSRMNTTSKEAITELMYTQLNRWAGLSTAEQQQFEMPYFGHRWSENSIQLALVDAFDHPSTTVEARDLSITGRTLQSSGPRPHFSSGMSPIRGIRPANVRVAQSDSFALEEQFFNILRDAIMRAERQSPNGSSLVRSPIRVNGSVGVTSNGTNTHSTYNYENTSNGIPE